MIAMHGLENFSNRNACTASCFGKNSVAACFVHLGCKWFSPFGVLKIDQFEEAQSISGEDPLAGAGY